MFCGAEHALSQCNFCQWAFSYSLHSRRIRGFIFSIVMVLSQNSRPKETAWSASASVLFVRLRGGDPSSTRNTIVEPPGDTGTALGSTEGPFFAYSFM